MQVRAWRRAGYGFISNAGLNAGVCPRTKCRLLAILAPPLHRRARGRGSGRVIQPRRLFELTWSETWYNLVGLTGYRIEASDYTLRKFTPHPVEMKVYSVFKHYTLVASAITWSPLRNLVARLQH